MSRKEVTSVVEYCEEHNISFKERLTALEIPSWRFYEAKSFYTNADRLSGSGEFLNIPSGVSPRCQTYQQGPKRDHHKKPQAPSPLEASSLSVELQTPGGTLMRIQGEMSASVLKEIILAANGYVQS